MPEIALSIMENRLQEYVARAMSILYGKDIPESQIQIQETRDEFEGDFTVVVFPLLRLSGKGPEDTARELGDYLVKNSPEVEGYNVIKGFLNLGLTGKTWIGIAKLLSDNPNFGFVPVKKGAPVVLVEYSSPNTNKPLHLGHIRNNLLGFSLANILKANGNHVVMTNIVNDRGIHICKSMLAWKLYGKGETPENPPQKGDQLVGKYYIRFDTEYKKEVKKLISEGLTPEEAAQNSQLMLQAREMLLMWEAGDIEIVALWKMMNSWVYSGFEATYRDLGVSFDKIYYESETYKLGRNIVKEAVESGLLEQRDDKSVWADLTSDGLDHKLLLRGDGTAVYMTQDIGTAVERYNEFKFDRSIYVVGNEQNYHFQVLSILLKKLGYSWADGIFHFSYGMVELPAGKMKSREGTVVDADDLVSEMIETAREMSEKLGKLEEYSSKERKNIFRMIGLGALKYFILKIDPKKNMLFNPTESVDFNGNTGPFIQYTNARIKSILRKAGEFNRTFSDDLQLNEKEIDIIRILARFSSVVMEAGQSLSPALIANYCYDLVKQYNKFYHDYTILGEVNSELRSFRLELSLIVSNTIERGMGLLGIELPDRM